MFGPPNLACSDLTIFRIHAGLYGTWFQTSIFNGPVIQIDLPCEQSAERRMLDVIFAGRG